MPPLGAWIERTPPLGCVVGLPHQRALVELHTNRKAVTQMCSSAQWAAAQLGLRHDDGPRECFDYAAVTAGQCSSRLTRGRAQAIIDALPRASALSGGGL